MLKISSIICTLLVLAVVYAQDQAPKVDLCDLQAKVNDAVNGFSPDGQKAARTIFLDVQHELSNIIQKYFALVKTQNAATLTKLQNAEGGKLTSFLNAIGFYNATAFTGGQVDLCQIQTDMVGAYSKMQPSSQSTINKVAKYYLAQAKPELQGLSKVILNKDQALIFQLYKSEKMEKLMALANVMQSAFSIQ